MIESGNKRKATSTSSAHTNETRAVDKVAGGAEPVDEVAAASSDEVRVSKVFKYLIHD